MKYKLIYTLFFVTVVLGFVPTASSQTKPHTLSLLVSAENNDFSSSKNPKVRIEIKYDSGQKWYLRKGSSFDLNLERTIAQPDDCIQGECLFGMSTIGIKEILPGKSRQFEISLRKLHWADSISSFIDLSNPRNYSEMILSGKYRVYAMLKFFPEPWVNEDSPFALIRSNEIILTL